VNFGGIRNGFRSPITPHYQALSPVNFHSRTPTNIPKRVLYAAIAVMCVVTPSYATEFESLQLGFQGVGKVGTWLPAAATGQGLPAGETVQLRAIFSDPRGDDCVEIVDQGNVDDDGNTSLSGYFRSGRLEGMGQIQITQSDGKVLCQQTITHGPKVLPADNNAVCSKLNLLRLEVPFLLTIGKVTGIEELLRNADNFSDDQQLLHGVHFDSLAELPINSKGLHAIDLLLITDNYNTSAAQATTVQEWVLKGGRLFVSVGQSVSALVESEFGTWLDDRFGFRNQPINTRDLSALQGFVPGSTVMRRWDRPIEMAVLNNDQVVAEVKSLDGILIGAESVGAGFVTIVAIDLNKKPMTDWASLPQLYEVLFLGKKLSANTTQESRTSRISQSGISDLATQMMATVDSVPETGRWSTWAIMALIAAYLLLIGPLDYLFVTQVFKRPQITWITFPLLITIGAVGMYFLAGSDGRLQLNQLHVMDVVPAGDGSYTHTQSWMSVSSSQTMRGDLTATIALPELLANSDKIELNLEWSGRPEDIYGGMYRVGGIGLGRQSYIHNSQSPEKLTGVPLLTNGSRELVADWQLTTPDQLVSSDLSVSGFGLLNGTFSHSLPFEISDWAIMHGNRVYRTRSTGDDAVLAPGEVWDSKSDGVYAADLKAFLNAMRMVKDATKTSGKRGMTQVVTQYNAKSQDPVYVMTMATFYDAAGGSKYVGLSNALLDNVELSDTIRKNHAVLMGVADTPATHLTIGDQPQVASHTNTIVRLLLPIDRRPAKSLAPKADP